MSNIALKTTIQDIENEYNLKVANIDKTLAEFEQAITDLGVNACIQGYYGELIMPNSRGICKHSLLKSLKVSAWNLAYKKLQIDRLASESIKRLFKQSIPNPPEFSLNNCIETFGDIVLNPQKSILNAFAEVFMNLDQSYKSHEKVKIGVAGLPKRVIVSNLGSLHGYGRGKLQSIVDALACIEQKPLTTYDEVSNLMECGECKFDDSSKQPIKRGVKLKRFKNGNGHLYFEPEQLLNINRALAAFYGDVLPDSPEAGVNKKESTAVSKDLQFYKTPKELVEYILTDCVKYNSFQKGSIILEPSCGDGAIMDVLKNKGFNNIDGIEYEFNRANIARSKGHNVFIGNFLETEPVTKYDVVFMNPPFYGLHYVKHIEHAKKFLKAGGILYSILPITARDDHKKIKGGWSDLPAKSFAASGTNINTVLYEYNRT